MTVLRPGWAVAALMAFAGCDCGSGSGAPDAARADAGVRADVFVPSDTNSSADAPASADTPPDRDVPQRLDAWRASDVGRPADAQSGQDAPATACGGRTGTACPRGSFCDIPPENACGRTDGPGVCTPIPALCTREYAPVCGCDGITYGNACMAAMASASIEFRGPCTASCDVRLVACDTPAPLCTTGMAPSVVGTCWGACIPASSCTCLRSDECPNIPGYSELCYPRSGRCGPAL